jgi:dTDP-4-amino-4,6-dideoxygalactose transaminase
MVKTQKLAFGTMSITIKAKKIIKNALDCARLSCGKYVREFEDKFAALIGVKEAVAVSSGTDADTLALAVLYDFGLKRGDEVIIPALSFVATGNAVIHAGFTPVFVDIERDTLNIDARKIEKAITDRTKAIMPVHLMGKPADMDSIDKIAKKNNLFVIEDAAEAYGTEYRGKNAGTLGCMAAFSTYIAHLVSTIEGGVVVTDNQEFAAVLRSLRTHGRACKCKECLLNTADKMCGRRFANTANMDIRFIFERIGYSSKMNELEAAVGLGNIEIYENILSRRRENLLYLMKEFEKFKPYLTTLKEEKYEVIGPHAFAIIVNEKAKFSRDEFVYYLEKNGVDSRSLFLSMPTQCPGFAFLGHKLGEFPNAEYIGNHGLHIGIHQDLTRKNLDYFLKITENFLKTHR